MHEDFFKLVLLISMVSNLLKVNWTPATYH